MNDEDRSLAEYAVTLAFVAFLCWLFSSPLPAIVLVILLWGMS